MRLARDAEWHPESRICARMLRLQCHERLACVTAYHYVAAVALGSERLHAVLKKGDYVELAQSKHYADIEITVLSVP